jgi:hypothetical protein
MPSTRQIPDKAQGPNLEDAPLALLFVTRAQRSDDCRSLREFMHFWDLFRCRKLHRLGENNSTRRSYNSARFYFSILPTDRWTQIGARRIRTQERLTTRACTKLTLAPAPALALAPRTSDALQILDLVGVAFQTYEPVLIKIVYKLYQLYYF